MTGRVCGKLRAAFTVDADGPTDPPGSQWRCVYKVLCLSVCLLVSYIPDLEVKYNH